MNSRLMIHFIREGKDNGYQIVSAFFIIASLVLIFYCYNQRSELSAKYRGKVYVRESELVPSTIHHVEWEAGKGYTVYCKVEGERQLIALPASQGILHRFTEESDIKGGALFLICIQGKGERAYQLAPVKNTGVLAVYTDRLSSRSARRRNQQLQLINLVAGVLWCVGLFFLNGLPTLSIALSIVAAALFYRNQTYRMWTKNPNFCIIKEKSSEQIEQMGKDPFPAGYNDWTDNEKQLFKIDAKIGARNEPSEALDGLDSITIEQATEWETSENVLVEDLGDFEGSADKPDIKHKSIVPVACKNCGCIVDNDARFCSQCGARIQDDSGEPCIKQPDSIPSQNDPVYSEEDTPPEDEDISVTQETPIGKKSGRRRRRAKKAPSELGSLLNKVQDNSFNEL